MKHMGVKITFIVILSIFLLTISQTSSVFLNNAYGYYTVTVPFSSNNSWSGFPTFGVMPFVPTWYKNLTNPFSFGGIQSLFSSSALGLFGSGLFGMGGLYGLGGLYGMGGLYGLGGLYGMGSLYGLGGLYGVGGLYGLSGLYGSNILYGQSAWNPLASLGIIPGITGLGANLFPSFTANLPFVAEQAGTWTGTWNLGFLFGTMIMNLTENPITGILSGTAQLIGNPTFGGIFNILGTGSTTFVQLNGQDPTISYAITISGTLTTATTMTGFYSIYKVGGTSPLETGTFDLDLISAAVI